MDPNKKITGQDWLNLEIQKGLSKFASNTSNNTPENNFQTGLNAVGSFAANTIDSGLGDWRSEHKENLITGARGYVHQPEKEKDPNKPKDDKVEEEVTEEETLDSSRASGVGEITTQKQRIDKFLGLGNPDRIKKRTEIKDARQENRATNRLRRRTKNMSDKEKTDAGVKNIPSRKTAKETKKKRLNAAKVEYDKKVVEKTTAKE